MTSHNYNARSSIRAKTTMELLEDYGDHPMSEEVAINFPKCATIREAFYSTEKPNLRYLLRVAMLKLSGLK